MSLPTVTIAAPIRNREWILNQYLDHIIGLDYPKDRINIHFVLNDSTDFSREILLDFKKKYKNEYNEIHIDTYNRQVPEDARSALIRNKHIYTHLSVLRNHILSNVKTDYLFSVDSDILIPSNSLQKLLSHQKSIISGLIYNGYIENPAKPHKYTNIMRFNTDGVLRHINNYYTARAPLLERSKVIEVDVTGAFYLIRKDVCKIAKYGWHHQGEDVYFCNTVKENGYKIFCDISVYADHIMISRNPIREKTYETKNTGLCKYH